MIDACMQIPLGKGEKRYGDPTRGYLACQWVGKSWYFSSYVGYFFAPAGAKK